MIVVTGAAGFIGSCMVGKLNDEFYNDIAVVDNFSNPIKNKNLEGKRFSQKVDRDRFFSWLDSNHRLVQFVYHIGARTDTTEFDMDVLNKLNLDFSKQVWEKCVKYGLPLVYASSAATYGNGENGYSDDHDLIPSLIPLNPYGISKNEFDKWALLQEQKPYFWVGLKFFNVYGPNEYHKGRMASVIFHAYNQVVETGRMNLFRSHRPDYIDGGQQRDFIYVKDVLEVLFFLLHNRKKENNGIYNLGTGKAESFNELASAVFEAMECQPQVQFIDTPADIRDKYQYFTQAEMSKFQSIGYNNPFHSLREGVIDYIRKFRVEGKYY